MTEELVKYKANPTAVTPAEMMLMAIEKGLDLDKVEKPCFCRKDTMQTKHGKRTIWQWLNSRQTRLKLKKISG